MKRFTNALLIIALLILTGNTTATAQYITVTLAGTGTAGFSGDGGPANMAELNSSSSSDVCIDADQDIYFIDGGNSRIRKISATTNIITTVAGGGTSTIDGVLATSASLTGLTKMCSDAAGNLYVSTSNKIRMISAATGIITTVAGTGTAGYNGDGVAATSAKLSAPSGVCVDATGNLYIADVNNYRIRKVSAGTGIISTIAGTGTSGSTGNGGPATAATLDGDNSICIDASGNVYCANGGAIRKINAATDIITTLISPGEITGICSDGGGYIYYVQDSCGCIRLNLANNTTTTIANNGIDGYNGDGGNSIVMELNWPSGVCVDATGTLYIADSHNNRIRKIAKLTNAPSFIYGNNQSITQCPGYTGSINTSLAVADLDSPTTETWTVLTPPTTGTLAGFPATAMSGGRTGLATPTGTSYTPVTGNSAELDSFEVQVSNGIASAIVKIYVSINTENAGTISGASNMCAGSAIIFSDSTLGGTWSVTNSNASITGTGQVTGIVAGTDTVIYTLSSQCPVTTSHIIAINPLPDDGTINGPGSVCAGSAITLTDNVGSGVWTSSNSHANVSGSGIVNGVSTGADTVFYTVSNMCGTVSATQVINIDPLPDDGTITGPGSVCAGTAITLTDNAGGGTWTASNGNATVSGSGLVTAVSAGSDTVLYSVSNTCGTLSATQVININPLPDAGAITGDDNVCMGATITLDDTASGGTWSATNNYAFISSSGSVIGYLPGTDTITYIVSNTCGTVTATHAVTVNDCNEGVSNTVNPPAISIYPNPSTGLLNVAWTNLNTDHAHIIIRDIASRVVFSTDIVNTNNKGSIQLNLSALQEGMYLITVNSGSIYDTNKLVIGKQ